MAYQGYSSGTADSGSTADSNQASVGDLARGTTETVEVFHEWTPQPTNSSVERVIDIDRFNPPDNVRLVSHVVADFGKGFRSPEYLISIRRREAAKIAESVRGLAEWSESTQFQVWTQQPFEQLRLLIQRLSEAEQSAECPHEGNSCEILRQLRDTFLNLGWRHYRRREVRDCVTAILVYLARVYEVSSNDAELAMDQLFDLDMDPAVIPQLSCVQDDREADVSS